MENMRHKRKLFKIQQWGKLRQTKYAPIKMGHPCNGTLCSHFDGPLIDMERCLPYTTRAKSEFSKTDIQLDAIFVGKVAHILITVTGWRKLWSFCSEQLSLPNQYKLVVSRGRKEREKEVKWKSWCMSRMKVFITQRLFWFPFHSFIQENFKKIIEA